MEFPNLWEVFPLHQVFSLGISPAQMGNVTLSEKKHCGKFFFYTCNAYMLEGTNFSCNKSILVEANLYTQLSL